MPKPLRPYTLAAALLPLADGTRTRQQVADLLGVAYVTIIQAIERLRVDGYDPQFVRQKRTSQPPKPTDPAKVALWEARETERTAIAARNVDIITRIKAGETLTAVGLRYGITRERVRQICSKQSVLSVRNMAAMKAQGAAKRAARQAARQEKKVAHEALIAELRRLVVDEGLSVAKAAKRIGISIREAGYYATRYGIGQLSRHGRWRPDLPALKTRAVEVYKATGNQTEACRQTGLSIIAVHLALARAGLVPFTKNELSKGWDDDPSAHL